MHVKKNFVLLTRVALLSAVVALSGVAQATIYGVTLGTAAPPTSLGAYTMTPFDLTPQNAFPDMAVVTQIPSPLTGKLGFSPSTLKRDVNTTWFTWSHGYMGAVFRFTGTDSGTNGSLTLPLYSAAFYFYYEGEFLDTSTLTVTTNKGVTVGPLQVTGFGGAQGVGFYSDDPTETIQSINIQSDDPAFAVAEFGVAKGIQVANAQPVPTLSQSALILLAALMVAGGLMTVRRRS